MIVTYAAPQTQRELAEEVVRRLEDLWEVLPEGAKTWLKSAPNGDAWENRHNDPDEVCWNLVFGISLDEVWNIPLRQREYIAEPADPWAHLAFAD